MKVETDTVIADLLAVTPQQAFEWIVSGHWDIRDFEYWFGEQHDAALQEGYYRHRMMVKANLIIRDAI